MKGFLDFIRERGVVGLAVGFIVGGAISKLISSLTTDIVTPLVNIFIGSTADLKNATTTILGSTFKWGDFVANLIDFLALSLVVYIGVKVLGIEKLDKPES